MSVALTGLVRLGTSLPSTPVNRALSGGGLPRNDAVDGGPFDISGTVKISGTPDVPAARRVRLHDRLSGRPVRETWSSVDGAYSFPKMRPGSWYVIGFDHLGNYNAVIRDQISTG